jgi:hypothetical protein
MGLGLLLDIAVGAIDDRPGDQHRSLIEVDVTPSQRTQLASSGASGCGQAQEHPELGLLVVGEGHQAAHPARIGGRHLGP